MIGFIKCLGILALLVFFELNFCSQICLMISDWLLSFYNGFSMFQITSDYHYENISDWWVFKISFRLISDCFQIVRRISDCVFRFQIASDWPELTFQLPRLNTPRSRPKRPLEFSFKFCQIDFLDFRLASDCFHIHFRLYCTVWLKCIAHFEVDILLLHHYKSDLAHLSDLYSLVIGMYKYERWEKKNKQMKD